MRMSSVPFVTVVETLREDTYRSEAASHNGPRRLLVRRKVGEGDGSAGVM